MKNIIYTLLLMVSFNSLAEFKLTFSQQKPEQHIIQGGVYTGFFDLNLQIKASLANDEDYPGITSSLSYQFSCEGDEPMWLNQDSKGINGPYSLLYLNFARIKPSKWDKWPEGDKTCTLKWKGITTNSTNNQFKTLALSATDLDTSVIYDDSQTKLTTEQRNLSKPAEHTFTITKPEKRYLYSSQRCINIKTKVIQSP